MKIEVKGKNLIIPSVVAGYPISLSEESAKVLVNSSLEGLLSAAIEGEMSTMTNGDVHRVGYVPGKGGLALVIDESEKETVYITEVEADFFPDERCKHLYEFAVFEYNEETLSAIREALKEQA